jgi:hypothetical protein
VVEISNLTGLEKPITKLIETVSEAIGVVGNNFFEFDAKKIHRIGKAEAEAEKQRIISQAEAQSEASQILERAKKRMALEQYNRQINLENTLVKARQELEGKEVNDTPVDVDWTAKFLGVAQEVSDEEVQGILAKILAGEVQQPRTYSRRLLEILRNLSKEELKKFGKFAAYASHDGHIYVDQVNSSGLSKFGSFNDFIKLSEIGLINDNDTLVVTFEDEADNEKFIGERELLVDSGGNPRIDLKMILLTTIGKQLAVLLQPQLDIPADIDEYIQRAKKELERQGAKVTARPNLDND